MISGIIENENNKGKEIKHWIPNQVGDDIGVVFGDDSYYGSSIKDFEDDSGCAFEDDRSVVIPHLMRNPGSISFF